MQGQEAAGTILPWIIGLGLGTINTGVFFKMKTGLAHGVPDMIAKKGTTPSPGKHRTKHAYRLKAFHGRYRSGEPGCNQTAQGRSKAEIT